MITHFLLKNQGVCKALLFLYIPLLVVPPMKAQTNTKLKTVVIDAGHGGKDPGAVGKYAKEKDIVLSVALKLGAYINEFLPDVKVIYTRDKDVFIPLDVRATIANSNNADLFISIHANKVASDGVYGAETFVLGNHVSEEHLAVAKKENSVIMMEDDYSVKYQGFDPNSTESYIIFQLMQFVFFDQSNNLASLVQDQFTERAGRHNRGVKQAGFLVLRKTSMPSILVELGFLSNVTEEKYLISDEGQANLASAIFRSVREYKRQFEMKSQVSEISAKSQNVTTVKTIPNRDKIEYRVQVASSTTELKKGTGIYRVFDDVWMFADGNKHKYTTGYSSDYKEISKLLREVKKKVPDAFIIAFVNDKKVSVSEARKISDDN